MNYKKVIGLGILLWLIIFAAISAVLPWYQSLDWMKVVAAVFSGAVAFILAGRIKLSDAKEAFRCAAIWVATGLVLDFFITSNFNANIFSERVVWLGYALAAGAVFLRIGKEVGSKKDELVSSA